MATGQTVISLSHGSTPFNTVISIRHGSARVNTVISDRHGSTPVQRGSTRFVDGPRARVNTAVFDAVSHGHHGDTEDPTHQALETTRRRPAISAYLGELRRRSFCRQSRCPAWNHASQAVARSLRDGSDMNGTISHLPFAPLTKLISDGFYETVHERVVDSGSLSARPARDCPQR